MSSHSMTLTFESAKAATSLGEFLWIAMAVGGILYFGKLSKCFHCDFFFCVCCFHTATVEHRPTHTKYVPQCDISMWLMESFMIAEDDIVSLNWTSSEVPAAGIVKISISRLFFTRNRDVVSGENTQCVLGVNCAGKSFTRFILTASFFWKFDIHLDIHF